MKKTLISMVTATMLLTSNANATYAVFDGTALTQQILNYSQQVSDYAQQIKQYEELIKNNLNLEKQLEELGVNMKDIRQIFGSAMEAIENIENAYDTIRNVPENIKKQWEKVNEACMFLQENSTGFASDIEALNTIKSILGDTKANIDKCIRASQNPASIKQTLAELYEQYQNAKTEEEQVEIKDKMDNLELAQKVLNQETITATIQNTLDIYEDYHNEVAGKMSIIQKNSNTIKSFKDQITSGNLNEKQSMALNNSMMLRMLESNYELNRIMVGTQKVLGQIAQQNNKSNLTNEAFKRKTIIEKNEDIYPEEEAPKIQTNKYGIPIFGQ